MVTYQVKVTVDESIEQEWLHWMKTKHVPDVIATGLCRSYQILKPVSEARTYLFQYLFESSALYEKYQADFSPALAKEVVDRYPNQFKATRDTLEWV